MVRAAMLSMSWAVGLAWRSSRCWIAVRVLIGAAQAAIPAVQFFVVSELVAELTSGDSLVVVGWLAAAMVLVGVTLPLSQLALRIGARASVRQRRAALELLLDAACRLHPTEVASTNVTRRLSAAKEAIPDVARLAESLVIVIAAAVGAFALCAALWRQSPPVAALIGASLLPTVLVLGRIARREAKIWPELAQRNRYENYLLEQLFQQRPATELAALGTSSKVGSFAMLQRRMADELYDGVQGFAMRLETLSAGFTSLFFGAAIALFVYTERGAAPEVAGAIAGILVCLYSVRSAGNSAGAITSSLPRVQSFREFIDVDCDVLESERPGPVERISCENVRVRYPASATDAIRGISLEVRRGEIVAIVGLNGAGKTTLVNALTGLTKTEEGDVYIGDQSVKDWNLRHRLRHFGLMTQEFGRYELTVRRTLDLATPNEVTRESILEGLDRAHASGFVKDLPSGLDSQLGDQWGGSGVSGGQWQRLALARMYIRNAPIWILDEPTSAIDVEAEREIFRELWASRRERITVVVTHRPSTLTLMDRIYVLDAGQLVENGTFGELIATSGRFAELYGDGTPANHRESSQVACSAHSLCAGE